MKRLGSVFLLLLVLSGCIPTVPLNDRAMVRAVAVDLLEDGTYQMTLQVNEAADGGSQASSPEQTAITETGRDLTELLSKASISRGKQMFLGSTRLILLGERLAEKDILPTLRFFNATQQVAPTIAVAVVTGEAGELIRAGEKADQFSADGILDVLHKAQEAGYAPASRMLEFFSQEESQDGTPQLVLLEMERHQSEDSSSKTEKDAVKVFAETSSQEGEKTTRTADKLRVSGTVLFQSGQIAAHLDPTQTRGLQWFRERGRMKSTPLSVELPEGDLIAAKAYLERRRTRVRLENDRPLFTIQIEAKTAILELPEDLEADWKAQVETLQEQLITSEIQTALEATMREGWDPCGLSRLVRQQEAGYYWDHRNEWENWLSQSAFQVEVSCQVAHTSGTAQQRE